MTVQLNIKDPKTTALVAELAEIAAIVERARALVRPEDILTDDDIYDENGLPK